MICKHCRTDTVIWVGPLYDPHGTICTSCMGNNCQVDKDIDSCNGDQCELCQDDPGCHQFEDGDCA